MHLSTRCLFVSGLGHFGPASRSHSKPNVTYLSHGQYLGVGPRVLNMGNLSRVKKVMFLFGVFLGGHPTFYGHLINPYLLCPPMTGEVGE